MTAASLKTQNLIRALKLIRNQEGMTRQKLADSLQISMPTALNIVEELRSRHLVEEAGESESTGGRKAKTLRLNPGSGFSIGIQVVRAYIKIVITDIYGEVLFYKRCDYPYRDEPAWYRKMGAALIDVIDESGIDGRKITGVGISFPGIIDQERNILIHSHVFGLYNMDLDRFYKSIAYPLCIINDANSACFAERNPDLETYLYISLNETVGGSLVVNRNMYIGRHWQAGEVGHMILHPNGKKCYCGKKGCSDAYLNTYVLTRGKMDYSKYFQLLESGDKDAVKRFDKYIDDLAILISNLRMLLDMPIVLGGDLGSWLTPYIERICEETQKYDLFSRDVDYIDVCRCRDHKFAKGAALAVLDKNIHALLD